jgi:mediator of RNA polymerase II transcription subunit 22
VGEKDRFKVAQDAWEAECRAEAMVRSVSFQLFESVERTDLLQARAAESLLSISHTLKMIFILKDDEPAVKAVRKRVNDELRLAKEHERKHALERADAIISSLENKGDEN